MIRLTPGAASILDTLRRLRRLRRVTAGPCAGYWFDPRTVGEDGRIGAGTGCDGLVMAELVKAGLARIDGDDAFPTSAASQPDTLRNIGMAAPAARVG